MREFKSWIFLSALVFGLGCSESNSRSTPGVIDMPDAEAVSDMAAEGDAGALEDQGTEQDQSPGGDAGPTADMGEPDFGEPDISPMGGDRPVTPLMPANYDPRQPAGLVISLHGYGGSGPIQRSYFGLDNVLSENGYIFLAPNGTRDTSSQFWNATDACCNFYGSTVDDVAYLSGLIDEAQARFNINPNKVFFVGHSNGGFMSYRMACELSDRITGIVSLAGATFEDAGDCTPAEGVSVVQVHGTLDATVLYDGGVFFGGTYPGAEESVERWVSYNECDADGEEIGRLDISAELGEETLVTRWSGCRDGARVELWRMDGAGHIPGLNSGFADAVVSYFNSL